MNQMTLAFSDSPRLVALAAAVIAVALAVSATPQPAAAGNGYVLTIDSAVVPPGGAAAVELNLVAPDPGIGSYAIDILYDDSVVDIASCQSIVSGCNKVYGKGVVRIAAAPFASIVGERTLATLVFKTTGGGETALDVQATNLYDGLGAKVSTGADVFDGTIQAQQEGGPDIQLGDATCDGHVNASDAIRILAEQASATGDLCLPYGDYNCDDIVNTTDVIALLTDFADLAAASSC